MKITDTKLEAAMVSMAGTLLYLSDMAGMLAEKPLVPKSVEAFMSATQHELAALNVQFEAARLAAVADARPFLDEWLRRRGLEVGGVFRAKSRKASALGHALDITGGIAAARLHSSSVGGARVVDIALIEPAIVLQDGRVMATTDEIPVRDQADFNLCALRDYETRNIETGAMAMVLHVRIPIQESERGRWARNGNLVL